MDIRTYTAFVTVAELRNVTRAAERLHQTQSALSRQIKALEAHLGVPLFEKVGRNIRLTPQGEALHTRVNGVLAAERNVHALAEDIARGSSGLLRVGACSQLIERYMPTFLCDWQRQNPGIEIRLEDGGGPELAGKLRDGSLHLTVSAAPQMPVEALEQVPLGTLGFLAVGTPDLLPEGPATVELTAFLDQPILTLNRKHASREVFDAACRISGAAPRIVLESYSPHTLFAMAEGGVGIAVVPSSARAPSDRLVSRAIALRGTPVRFGICAMWNLRQALPGYGHRFIEALGAHIRADQSRDDPGTARYGRLQVV
ncbi:LysR family transcriptional regulator [Sinirhodobacter populi]|uniref:LysR family transcriptional regulator n=1 Tax=Paenirhodobacter populi TaxID=2306993 RepID=A0A443K550_9RHOB|nr:LysR family transcriptional regulator [Sinirhodobacter populi]RWR27891.1 LysR family transcriptional regulator [Sinirhodobacter populi]